MQKIKYSFDHAGNITNIFNDVTPFGAFNGQYNNRYRYDGLHRLVGSDGDNMLGLYDMEMRYSPSGRIAHKQYTLPARALSHPVDMYYGYCDKYQPHAVRRIFDKEGGLLDFRWDKAGNLGQISFAKPDGYFVGGRFLFWTEDNRMHAAVDEEHYSYYAYDYSGERRLKLTGKSDRLDVNAEFMHTTTPLDNPTLYPSAYLVLTKNEYTKHYYAGADRVAACLGGGEMDLSMMWGDSYTGRLDPQDVQGVSDKLFKQSIKQVGGRVLEPNDLGCIKEIFKGEFDDVLHNPIDGIPNRLRTNVGFKYYDFRRKVEELRHYQHDEGKYVYYYHSDHLGSASWITNHNGDAVQHIQYLPYGEPYVDKRTGGYSERFRFTGKERDEETGYGYFGARYMDHELMTMWLSVDPMADKYPNISPYAYCNWNPVKLVDPDGNEAMDNDDWYKNKETGAVLWQEGHDKQIKCGGDTYENIGESYSAPNIDGTYSNYYQNYLITIGNEQDASKMAYRDKGLRTFLISNRSKLPVCHKLDLFKSHVASRGVYPYQPTSGGHAIGIDATFCGIVGLNLHGGLFIDSDGGLGLYGGVNYCTGVEVGLGLEYSHIPTGQIHSGENQLFSVGFIWSGSYNIMSKSWSLSKSGVGIEAGLSTQVGWTWYSQAIPLF